MSVFIRVGGSCRWGALMMTKLNAETWKLFPSTARAAVAPCRALHSALNLSPLFASFLIAVTLVRTCPHHRGVLERRIFPFSIPPWECRCLSVIEISNPAAPTGRLTAPSDSWEVSSHCCFVIQWHRFCYAAHSYRFHPVNVVCVSSTPTR